eukprot:9026298-Pyramimonas_sp.AAC.1
MPPLLLRSGFARQGGVLGLLLCVRWVPAPPIPPAKHCVARLGPRVEVEVAVLLRPPELGPIEVVLAALVGRVTPAFSGAQIFETVVVLEALLEEIRQGVRAAVGRICEN